jgi:orotidine-5'-phosphate decarboxylase
MPAAGQRRAPPLLIAVTVLTSLADVDLRETGVAGTATQQALDLHASRPPAVSTARSARRSTHRAARRAR